MGEVKHRSGFVNIIGKPNVGKSTLMNAITGENLSIITSKAQTTRHRILGIMNGEDFQVIFSDTPGFIKPQYRLHQSMMNFVHSAFEDADAVILVIDLTDKRTEEQDPELQELLTYIDKNKAPLLLVLNKTDMVDQERVDAAITRWENRLSPKHIFPISALKGENIEPIFNNVLEYLPNHPPYYNKEELTDRPERFFVSEIIREKIFLNYKQEIPYSTEVIVEAYQETPDIDRIRALIFVERQSQKPIVIGRGGSKLKTVGTEARKDIETFLDKKVYLELFVKVKENWRENKDLLKQWGYH